MNDIVLLTLEFPYGRRETFLELEINYLSDKFDNVYLIPLDTDQTDTKRSIPPNVTVLQPKIAKASLVGFLPFLGLLLQSPSKQISVLKTKRNSFKYKINTLRQAYYYLRILEPIIRTNQLGDKLFYSYWADYWLLSLLKIKSAGNPKMKIVTRLHNYDLYHERSPIGYYPFKDYIFRRIDALYPISKQGREYLKANFPKSAPIKTFRLGVEPIDHALMQENHQFNIVSCSYVTEVKRVGLIADALMNVKDIPINWTHFGSGPLFKPLQEKVKLLPKNVRVTLKGQVKHSEIINHYALNGLDLFINVSTWEGIPVSIMEAISAGSMVIATDAGSNKEVVAYAFGKPVVATKVGSIPEVVVDNKTGLLVAAKNPFEIADAIIKILTDTNKKTEMGNHALQITKNLLSWDTIAKETVKAYLS